MPKLVNWIQRWRNANIKLAQLELSYQGKIKGRAHAARYLQINKEINFAHRKVKYMGSEHNLVRCTFTTHIKAERGYQEVTNQMYLTDVTLEEARMVVKIKHTNAYDVVCKEKKVGVASTVT